MKAIFVFFVFCLASCATNITTISVDDPDLKPSSDSAVIYVYRDYAIPLLFPAYVRVDGEIVAVLGNGEYTSFGLGEGEQTLTYAWPLLSAPRVEVSLDVEPGNTYAFELTSSGGAYYARYTLRNMPYGDALEAIGECCEYVILE